MYDQAWHQTELGNLKGALEQAESGISKYTKPQSEWHWRFRLLKAEILMRQGLYDESLALVSKELPGEFVRSETAVWQLLTKGSVLAYLGRTPEAEAALNNAKTLASSVAPQLVGEAMLRIGTLASLTWNLPKAQASYREALQHARGEKRNAFLEASALGGLGLVAVQMEHYDESVDWNKQALDAAKSADALGLVAKIEGNIAWSYLMIGDTENSLNLNKDAERDALLAGLQEDRVVSVLSQGRVYLDTQDYAAAEIETRKALDLAKGLKDAADEIYCNLNLALIALAKNLVAEAQEDVDEAIQLESAAPDQSQRLYIELIGAQVAMATDNLERAEGAYSKLIADSLAPVSLRWEAQAGLAQVHAAQGKIAWAEKEFQGSISTISQAWNAIEHEEFRLSFLTSAIRFYGAYVNYLIEQKRPLDALKIADLSRAQTLEHGLSADKKEKGVQPVAFRPQDTARRLKATLLFYWLGDKRSFLWVVNSSNVTLIPLPARSGIETAVKSYRDAFLDPRDPLEAGNADGKKLYATLIEPAEKLIPKGSRVIVLPDGKLGLLNFETLIVPGEMPHYWIEDATVQTANSLSLLSKSTVSSAPKEASLFLMGDPISASPDFPTLPQAGKEVGLVENYFAKDHRSVLTGAQATASRFLSGKPEEFSYLHFATHGTASTTRPLESAVILSPEGDSYKLYARDIVQHPLHAYLVTISACNGAGMKTYAGEGLVGLAWAFLRAGAHNVIAGLWEVSNASTPQLMDELYKGLHEGQDPATALRNAKLTLVHSSGNYRRPFYWAPFQLYAGS